MHSQLQKASSSGDVTIFDSISKGEIRINDSDIRSTDESKCNIIHIAAHNNHGEFIRRACSDIKREVLLTLLVGRTSSGSTPLHVAAFYGCFEALKVMVEFCRSELCSHDPQQEEGLIDAAKAPWMAVNKGDRTPLHDALIKGHDEIGSYILSLDAASLYDMVTKKKESPLFLAVENGCNRVIAQILSLDAPATDSSFRGPDGRTALHLAIINQCQEGITKQMVEKLIQNQRDDIIWQKDSTGWTPLHYAAKQGKDWQIELLLQRPPASNVFMFDQRSESPLFLAWNSGHISTVKTILRCYPAMIEWRNENNTTLLHHIQLPSSEEYRRILRMPETQRILNISDNSGMTPLHQAILDGNFLLTELLFEMDGVNKAIKNKDGKTPIDLLVEKSQHLIEFAELRDRPGIIPRGMYITYQADLKEVRSTVMVVAALLAGITFQAAFQVPDATEKSRPAFVIFIMADTAAMSFSLVVLFWLIWAMVEDNSEKSRMLADNSFLMLQVSFYCTLVAFAAAMFPIALKKGIWLAIVVRALCCFVPLFSNKKIVSKAFMVKHSTHSSSAISSRYSRRTWKAHSQEQGTRASQV